MEIQDKGVQKNKEQCLEKYKKRNHRFFAKSKKI